MPPHHVTRRFSYSSLLAAPAAEVWAHAMSPRGINHELWPLARMTFPAGKENFAEDFDRKFVPGQRLFRSWIFIGGLLPLDYDDITLVEVEPGRRFLERSKMLSQRMWQHERTIEPTARGCRVIDRVEFVPRIGMLGPLYTPIFKMAFRLRHRNLQRVFGRVDA